MGGKVTYRSATFAYTPYATPTDIIAITGAAGKQVRITYIYLWGSSTSASNQDFGLIKRSTANTGGTPTTLTAVPLDSANVAATATVQTYAAAPTTGNAVGTLGVEQANMPATAGAGGSPLTWTFGVRNAQSVVLRGANEVLAINYNGAAVPAGTVLQFEMEWTEE